MIRSTCLLALALASGSAGALGLGQLQVRSGPGQPLVADIAVISSDPSEIANLRAELASPETFTRVGLEPPMGVVAGLQFEVDTNAAGKSFIRVTSTEPVTDPALTFLVQVDWGQGRLVREYSATVNSPGSIASVSEGPVEAPVVEAPQVIERAAPVVVAPQAPAPTPTPKATPARAPAPVVASARQPAPAATSAQRSRSVSPAAPPKESAATVAVAAGDSLSKIAARVAPEGVTPQQTMIGLFRNNAAAFIGGDINQVRQGAVLRVPATPELQAVEAREAAALVGTYARQWRQARTSVRSAPVTAVAAAAPRTAVTSPPAATRETGGRLEIVPPGGGKTPQAGQQSGIASGGEGEMLRQELQQTRETLAARDAEVQELKSRLTELERLKADQQKLIALQSTQMNAAQERTAQQPQPAPARATASVLPWIAGSLVLLALVAFAWMRRRGPATPDFRAAAAKPSIADAFAPTVEVAPIAADTRVAAEGSVVEPLRSAPVSGPVAPAVAATRAPAGKSKKSVPSILQSGSGTGIRETPAAASALATTSAPASPPPSAAPSWQKSTTRSRPAPTSAPVAPAASVPAWVAPNGTQPRETADGPDFSASQVDPASAERLELAQAYLDLGDTANARALLDEVAGSSDATARSVATRMLRTLG